MTKSDLQKVVVLCVAVAVILIGGWLMVEDEKENVETQIDPPSLQLETGPQNAETTEYPEVEPGDTLPPEVDEQGQDLPPPENNPVACTMDAKQCPDGSYVGREGPDCEFAECPSEGGPVSNCTLDTMQCPDGSWVNRTAPHCEFAECPGSLEKGGSVICSPESKQVEACADVYQPVCGLVEVQCFTTPCDPVPETFGNSCSACAQGNVISYTEGGCQE